MSIILNSSIKQKANAVIVFMAFALSFSACGGDSSSSSNEFDENDGREVATVVDMGRCTSEREGDTVYVAEKMKDYLCKNRSWVDLSEIVDGEQSSSSDKKTTHSSSSATSNKSSAASVKSSSSSVAAAKSSSSSFVSIISSATSSTSSLTSNVSSSSSSKAVSPQTFIRENISVTGVAQKGPFKFGSPLNLYELKNDLNQSGRVYKDEVNSNKGDFVIPKVNLVYPYAKLEVRGLYRNEVTGEWSKDSMTLRTLTDFSDKRTGTNLNDRVQVNINLLTHLEYDRALYLVQNKGYSVFAAKKQAAQEIMTAFEFATAVTYSEDFAIFQNEGVSAGTIAGNASLLAISALVMGNRSDTEIQSAIDKFREDIKTDGEWNDLQTKANMADWAYDIDYSKIRAAVKSWNILDIPDYETYLDIFWNNVYGLGGCSVNRKGVVASNNNKLSKYCSEYFICKRNDSKYSWGLATTFEKDTYQWTGEKIGELKKGNVTDSVYVYDGSKWNVSERETAIGLCGKSNAGVVSKFDNVYYICRNDAWGKATELEYDTYGLIGVEGDVKTGVVNKNKYYIFENGYWRTATLLECDTYGKTCMKDGSIVSGKVFSANKYVCDADTFRFAWNTETSLGKGCVSYTEDDEIRKHLSATRDSVYLCKNSWWIPSIEFMYGTLTDSRDNKVYRTIDIGSQTWMAENLNYSDSLNYVGMKGRSWCYNNIDDFCTKYGRLYTWAAVMDSAGVWSSNGEGCGSGKTCSVTTPVRGICPEGWHIPDTTEWNMLIAAVGGNSFANKMLKSSSDDWFEKGTDSFGFNAYPAGYKVKDKYYSGRRDITFFWSSFEENNGYANGLFLYSATDNLQVFENMSIGGKYDGCSVRCVKD